MKIYVIGDTHGSFGWLNEFIAKEKPDMIFVCGDFGVWKMHNDMWYHECIRNPSTKIYFCDGNHETHTYLAGLVKEHGWREPIEIQKDIYYCPRGSSITLEDGRRVLFFGGALSVDKHLRKAYKDWFPEELITKEECDRISDGDKYDIVITHTCPHEFHDKMLGVCDNPWKSKPDVSEMYLSEIFQKVKPSLWYFGHWHTGAEFDYEGCKFYAMNMTPLNRIYSDYLCYRELQEKKQWD